MTFADLKSRVDKLQLYYDPFDVDHYFCYENGTMWSYDKGDRIWDKFVLEPNDNIPELLAEKLSRVTALSFMLLTGLNPEELFAFNTKGSVNVNNASLVAQLKQQIVDNANQNATANEATIFCKHLMSISREEAQAVLRYIAADKGVYNSIYARSMMLELGKNSSLYYRALGHHNATEFWRQILVHRLCVLSSNEFNRLAELQRIK